MKRVIYILTLSLFLFGLTGPTVSYAGNCERSVMSTHDARIERDSPSVQNRPVSNDQKAGWAWNTVFCDLVHLLNCPTGIAFIDIPSFKTWDRDSDPDRPLTVQNPPGEKPRMKHPDKDDDGWEEHKR